MHIYKAGKKGMSSFIKSSFRGENNKYFNHSDFRLVYNYPVKITKEEIVKNEIISHHIATLLNKKNQNLIEELSKENTSISI